MAHIGANRYFPSSGESYAGVYVPTLSFEVVRGKPSLIKSDGCMVGNGIVDETFDGNALVPFVHGMGLILEDLYQNILEPYYYGDSSSDIKLANSKLLASFRKLGETERPLPVGTRMFGGPGLFGPQLSLVACLLGPSFSTVQKASDVL
ncbi:serine carboxypeptidase 1-like [Bidens hawaiensis]|uniref:serine carboxypeptidase 1-like n=1 Tax=Bidens hawaiensis TaxID=980011 RepID=UPI00404B51EC